MNSKVSTHLYLPEDLYRQLYLLARMKNTSLTQVIKEILAANVKEESRKTEGSSLLGKLISYKIKGPKDLSANYKKYLFG